MSWRDLRYCDRQKLVVCPGGHGETYDADRCAAMMQEADELLRAKGKEPRFYAYGDHVSDPLAVVKRFLGFTGHKNVPEGLNKMWCPMHRPDGYDLD